jgi:hypothetical protein
LGFVLSFTFDGRPDRTDHTGSEVGFSAFQDHTAGRAITWYGTAVQQVIVNIGLMGLGGF